MGQAPHTPSLEGARTGRAFSPCTRSDFETQCGLVTHGHQWDDGHPAWPAWPPPVQSVQLEMI